jgi:hypothetical protein
VADLIFKRGDLKRPIVRKLREEITDEETGTVYIQPIDLTGATTVELLLKDQAGASTGGGMTTITNAQDGEVTYLTQAGDTATVRTWIMEYEITWADGGIETIPNEPPRDPITGQARTDAYYTVQILQDAG